MQGQGGIRQGDVCAAIREHHVWGQASLTTGAGTTDLICAWRLVCIQSVATEVTGKRGVEVNGNPLSTRVAAGKSGSTKMSSKESRSQSWLRLSDSLQFLEVPSPSLRVGLALNDSSLVAHPVLCLIRKDLGVRLDAPQTQHHNILAQIMLWWPWYSSHTSSCCLNPWFAL